MGWAIKFEGLLYLFLQTSRRVLAGNQKVNSGISFQLQEVRYEVKTQLQLAESLGYLRVASDIFLLINEIGKLINGLSRSLKASD